MYIYKLQIYMQAYIYTYIHMLYVYILYMYIYNKDEHCRLI